MPPPKKMEETQFELFGHFHFTFGKRGARTPHLLPFLVLTAGGFLLSNAIIFMMLKVLGSADWAAIAAVVLIVPAVSWLVSRHWVFK